MKIRKVVIHNYRSIRHVRIDLRDWIGFIGENNVGKTNILMALRLFFSPTARGLSEDDFFKGKAQGEENAIRISVEFHQVTDRERKKFRKYLIDNRLTVRKSFWLGEDGGLESRLQARVVEPKQDFLKLSKFDVYKDILTEIVKKNDLPDYFRAESGRVTQASYKEGVQRYIEEHRDKIEWDEPTYSDGFYGWKEVAQGYMPEFLYVPAVRDVSEESKVSGSTFFGKLIEAMISNMVEKNPKIADFKEYLERLGGMISRGENGSEDERLEEIKEFEDRLTDVLGDSMPGTEVEIQSNPPTVRDFFRFGTTILVDDGIRTIIESKGHGLQRAMILAIFRAYADFLRTRIGSDEKENGASFIFAIEEPELFLHPHSQRKLFDVLKQISRRDQVIYCTHSPHFVNIADYSSVCIVCKSDVAQGTKVFQYAGELFDPDEREEFVAALACGTTQSELFFAKKVVLVEGSTDAIAISLIAEKLDKDLNGKGISIVEAGGKTNIPRFLKILNAFKIPYIVAYDVDPEKEESESQNRAITDNLNQEIGGAKPINPDIDRVLGISATQKEKLGGPYAAQRRIGEMSIEDVPGELREILEWALS